MSDIEEQQQIRSLRCGCSTSPFSECSEAPPPSLGLLFLPAGTNESVRRLPTTVIYKSEARQKIRSHV